MRAAEPLLGPGSSAVALTYLGRTQTTVKDDAFFCYAAARLLGTNRPRIYQFLQQTDPSQRQRNS